MGYSSPIGPISGVLHMHQVATEDIHLPNLGIIPPLVELKIDAPPVTNVIQPAEVILGNAQTIKKSRNPLNGCLLDKLIGNMISTAKMTVSGFAAAGKMFAEKVGKNPIGATLGLLLYGSTLLVSAVLKAAIWIPGLVVGDAAALIGVGIGFIFGGIQKESISTGMKLVSDIVGYPLATALTILSAATIVFRGPMWTIGLFSSWLLKGSEKELSKEHAKNYMILNAALYQTNQDTVSLWTGGYDSVWRERINLLPKDKKEIKNLQKENVQLIAKLNNLKSVEQEYASEESKLKESLSSLRDHMLSSVRADIDLIKVEQNDLIQKMREIREKRNQDRNMINDLEKQIASVRQTIEDIKKKNFTESMQALYHAGANPYEKMWANDQPLVLGKRLGVHFNKEVYDREKDQYVTVLSYEKDLAEFLKKNNIHFKDSGIWRGRV